MRTEFKQSDSEVVGLSDGSACAVEIQLKVRTQVHRKAQPGWFVPAMQVKLTVEETESRTPIASNSMFGLKTFCFGLMLGCIGCYLSMQFHVVNTNDGLIVLPRAHRPTLRSVYVDVRKWSLSMWKQHPEVAEAAVLSGRPDLLAEGALNSILPEGTSAAGQATQPTSAENAKIAMDALVPIRFSNPQPETHHLSTGNSFLPIKIPTIDFNWHQTAPEQVRNIPVPDIQDEVLPTDFPWKNLDESKFPILKQPVPIDEPAPARSQQASPSSDSGSDWFRSLLKNLIPSGEQASVQPNAQQQAARQNPMINNNNAPAWAGQSNALPNPALGTNRHAPVNPFLQQPAPNNRIYPAVRPF